MRSHCGGICVAGAVCESIPPLPSWEVFAERSAGVDNVWLAIRPVLKVWHGGGGAWVSFREKVGGCLRQDPAFFRNATGKHGENFCAFFRFFP